MTHSAVGQPDSHGIKPSASLHRGINIADIGSVIDAGLTDDSLANAHVAIAVDIQPRFIADGGVEAAAYVETERIKPECVVPDSVDVVEKRERTECVIGLAIDVANKRGGAKGVVAISQSGTT